MLFKKINKNAGKNMLCGRMYNPNSPKHCAVLLVNDNANVGTAKSYKTSVSTRFFSSNVNRFQPQVNRFSMC